jgi:predicted transcriptional regulator
LQTSNLAGNVGGKESDKESKERVENEEKELTLHPDRQGLHMVLGDLEAEIMEVIWRRPDGKWCTVRDVYETMRDERERRIAYTTVMNTMSRLAKKGVLESSRQDLAYIYRPRQSREAFIQGMVGHVLERLLVQFTGPTQSGLQEYAARHPEETARVNDLLAEVTRRRANRARKSTSDQDPPDPRRSRVPNDHEDSGEQS